MSALSPLPSREDILAYGIPPGLVEYYRRQARIERARAIAQAAARGWRALRGALALSRASRDDPGLERRAV